MCKRASQSINTNLLAQHSSGLLPKRTPTSTCSIHQRTSIARWRIAGGSTSTRLPILWTSRHAPASHTFRTTFLHRSPISWSSTNSTVAAAVVRAMTTWSMSTHSTVHNPRILERTSPRLSIQLP
uniref:(northern house mosquito) hypothetical protein n=1 Tax=Culex pipiens TaxID=7175 RepID=A0A8D8ADB1_CULPI